MINKIKQLGEQSKARSSFNRHLNSKSKITEFLLQRMMERVNPNSCGSPFIIGNAGTDVSANDLSEQKNFISIKREVIKTESSPPRVEYSTKQVKSKSKLSDILGKEVEIEQSSKNYQAKNIKIVSNGRQCDFNAFLNEQMKKKKEKKKKKQLSKEELGGVYFGLNVVPIKKKDDNNKDYQRKFKIPVRLKARLAELSRQQDDSDIKQQKASCKQLQIKHISTLSPLKMALNESTEQLTTKQKEQASKDAGQSPYYRKQRPKTRVQQINLFHQKMSKMFDCLDLILNSFHCRLSRQKKVPEDKSFLFKQSLENIVKPLIRKEKNKYFYFIGNGNNANLIRSLFRKRSWWSEVDSVAKANFVWTQLRIACVLQKMARFNDQNWSSSIIFYEQINEEFHLTVSTNKNSSKKSNSTSSSEIFRLKQVSLNQIFHEKQSKRYHKLLQQKQAEGRLQTIESPHLVHNHFEHNYMFGNKNALYYNISKYYEFVHKKLGTITPLTFYLEKGNKKALGEFQKIYNDSKKFGTIWILKPAENSNRGQGIEVTASLSDIKLKLNTEKKLIVQYYLKNLLLYNGRKFDIRTYMMALTINGRMKFYWYEEGYVRTSSEFYDLENLRDTFIHLTNDAIQKNGQNYGMYQQGNKLSYGELQRYIQTRFPRQGWKVSNLHEQMKEIARETIKATYCRIDPERKNFSFQLFGLDFLVDSHFKPYLIEINTNPCLELSAPILVRLIPRMLQNMFRLCVDPIFRPNIDNSYSKSELYYMYDETFLQRNKFTVIFDQKFDRDFEWQEKCKKMRGIEWSNDQEQQYEDEGRIIVVDY